MRRPRCPRKPYLLRVANLHPRTVRIVYRRGGLVSEAAWWMPLGVAFWPDYF